MPRHSRHLEADTVYHATARGVDRQDIFHSDADRQQFMSLLHAAFREASASLFAYCLMGNHFHLLTASGAIPLSTPLHKALTTYALNFNARYRRTGHLFQARFYSHPIHDTAYLQNCVAYIHANPVRAGFVRTIPEWKWSSHEDWRQFRQGAIDFARLAELTGIPSETLRQEYLRRAEFASVPALLTIPELIADTARMLGLAPDALVSGRRGTILTKAKLILIKRTRQGGYPLLRLAEALNCSPAALTMLSKRA